MPWYPDMRKQLVDTARVLADPEYQQRVWIGRQMPEGIDDDSLDYAVHFIYDDTCLADDPREAIGSYVRDENEALAIERLARALDALFDVHGTDLADVQYVATAEWRAVVAAAKHLHGMFE